MLIFIANVIMKGIRGSVWNHLSQNQVFGKIKCRENSSYYVFIIVEILFNISVLFQLWQNILGIKIEAVCKWITAFPNTSFTDMKIENMRCFDRQQANTPQKRKQCFWIKNKISGSTSTIMDISLIGKSHGCQYYLKNCLLTLLSTTSTGRPIRVTYIRSR